METGDPKPNALTETPSLSSLSRTVHARARRRDGSSEQVVAPPQSRRMFRPQRVEFTRGLHSYGEQAFDAKFSETIHGICRV